MSNIMTAPNVVSALLDAGNPNLNGTGIMDALIVGADDGTTLKKISIKALGPTSQGMIRFFIDDGVSSFLFLEVMVPASLPTGVVSSFGVDVDFPLFLKNGYTLKASTQNPELFSVVAYGSNMAACPCPE